MAFDPDAYLAQTDTTGFDPDAYLAGGKPSLLSRVGSALKGAGKSALDFASFVGQIGQPQKAQDFASSVAQPNAADSSQQDPNNAGNLLVSGLDAGMGSPSLPAPIAHLVASAAVNSATSPMTYLGGLGEIPAVKASLAASANLPEKLVTDMASSSTGISKDALNAASTPEGRATLNAAVQSAPQKVQQLVDIANNSKPFMADATAAVRGPEQAAGRIDIRPILQAFDDAKFGVTDLGGNSQLRNGANAALEAEKNSIAGNLVGNGGTSPPYQVTSNPRLSLNGFQEAPPSQKVTTQTNTYPSGPPTDVNGVTDYTIPATQLRQLKTSIGQSIPWDSPFAAPVKQALKGVYSKMDDVLTDAVSKTQGPEAAQAYQDALADWSGKIGDFQELQKRIGATPSTQINRANSLLTLTKSNQGGNIDLLNRIDQQAGTDFSTHAQNLKTASEFSDQNNPLGTGNPSLTPQGGWWGAMRRVGGPMSVGAGVGDAVAGHTGAAIGSGLGAMVGLPSEALASPAIASRVAIPLSRIPQNIPSYLRDAAQFMLITSPTTLAATSTLTKIANPDSQQNTQTPNIPPYLLHAVGQ